MCLQLVMLSSLVLQTAPPYFPSSENEISVRRGREASIEYKRCYPGKGFPLRTLLFSSQHVFRVFHSADTELFSARGHGLLRWAVPPLSPPSMGYPLIFVHPWKKGFAISNLLYVHT